MKEEYHEVKQGDSPYVRWQVAEQIKNAFKNDAELAKQMYAWLKTNGCTLSKY